MQENIIDFLERTYWRCGIVSVCVYRSFELHRIIFDFLTFS